MQKILILLLVMNILPAKRVYSNAVPRQSGNPFGLRNCEDVYDGPCALLEKGRRVPKVKRHTGTKKVPVRVYPQDLQIEGGTFSRVNFYSGSFGGFNQSVIDLKHAIGKNESGNNYSVADGKDGEVGAYQFTQEAWNSMARKYGIYTPLRKATPQEQDFVVCSQIRDWQRQGWMPKEILSMWNAGDGEPHAHDGVFHRNTKTHRAGSPSKGRNPRGVRFDVPRYANQGYSEYQRQKRKNLWRAGGV